MKCKEGKTRPCGKGCRAIGKPCGKDPPPPGTVTINGRKCKPGVTRPCGKSCRSVCKPCKKDNTPGIPCDPPGRPVVRRPRGGRRYDEFDVELGYQRAMRVLGPIDAAEAAQSERERQLLMAASTPAAQSRRPLRADPRIVYTKRKRTGVI